MKRIIHIVIILFAFPVLVWGKDFVPADDYEEYVREGRRQYERLVEFNEQNRREGRTGENLYILSLSKDADFLEQWVAYRTMNTREQDQYSSAFLGKLNTFLNDLNSGKPLGHEVYVCLVSNFKVKLVKEINQNLTTQQDVLGALKKAYDESKTTQNQTALDSYKKYLADSEAQINATIDKAFSKKDPNHVILSTISYFQFELDGKEKLATYRRGTHLLRINGLDPEKATGLLGELARQTTEEPKTLGALNSSEQKIEQLVKKIVLYLKNGTNPDTQSADIIDISKIDQQTAQARDANWANDVQALSAQLASESVPGSGAAYVINSFLASKIGLTDDVLVYEEKFRHLKNKTDDQIHVVVAFKEVSYTIPDSRKDEFAKEVLARIGTGKNVVVVTVPLYSFKDSKNKDQVVSSLGLACQPEGNVDAQFQRSPSTRTFILNAYKRIPKPFTAHVYTISVNRQVEYQEKKSNGPIRGQAAVDDILIYKSKFLDELDQLSFPTCTNQACGIDPLYRQRVEEYYKKRFEIIEEGLRKELEDRNNSFVGINSNQWQSKRLKESKVADKHLSYFEYASKGDLAQWFHDVGILAGATTLTQDDFYKFDQWAVIDPIVYGVIDIAGLIPVVGDFTDGLGLAYAAVRADAGQIQNYTIGLSIIGGSAIMVKGVKKMYTIIAKRNKVTNAIELTEKELSAVTPDESLDVIANVGEDGVANAKAKIIDELKVDGEIVSSLPALNLVESVQKKLADAGLLRSARVHQFEKILARSNLNESGAEGAIDGLIVLLNKVGDKDVQNLVAKLDGLGDDALKTFLNDIGPGGLGNKIDWTKLDVNLVDAWTILKNSNLSNAIGNNVANLDRISNALKQSGYDAVYFENLLKSKIDPQKFLDSYLSKLGKDGKFVDNTLETSYSQYGTRKARQGKPPRDRADWNEASDYMKYHSPTARGNNFNKKGALVYSINELNLVLKDGSFVRVDSYVHPSESADGIGKIISRKATDLVDIDETAFRNHLLEMKTKYAPGTEIRSQAYPALNRQTIEGKQYLELPESNKSFYDIERYKDIARNEYGIEIIFLAE